MPVTTTGVIVIANAEEVTIKTQPTGVHLLWRHVLVRWLRSLPTVLDDRRIDAIYEMARRSTTWRPSGG